jgi:hypothetical protein
MRQFKLRLRDGTILAVDQAGLRTWLIDDRAMVQPMGTRGWRPLKEVVAYLATAPPPPRPEPAPETRATRTLADDEIPAVPIQEPSLAPAAEAAAPARRERVAGRPPEAAPPSAPAAAPVAAAAVPAADPATSKGPARPAAPPAAPAKAAPKPKGAPKAAPSAPAAPRAAAAPPRVAAAPLIPEAPPEPAPTPLEDLPVIPLKPLDAPAGERASVRVAASSDAAADSDLADALALVIQREVAQGHAVVISEDDLEEIDLVEDDGTGQGPAQPLPPLAAAISSGLQHAAGWVGTAVSNVRARAASGHPAEGGPAAAPPAPIAELPSIPLAPQPGTRPKPNVRLVAIAAGVAVAAVAGVLGVRWLRAGTGTASAVALSAPPTLPPAPAAPARRPEVEAAIAKLPHLAPDTIQILFDTSPFASPDAPDVFRRGWQAQRRGLAALTPEEAQELRVLERAMLVRLGPAERERVLAYERMRSHRDLAPGEDARVAGLVARGVRGLPPEQRERLHALSGKAIAAAVAAEAAASPAATASVR